MIIKLVDWNVIIVIKNFLMRIKVIDQKIALIHFEYFLLIKYHFT